MSEEKTFANPQEEIEYWKNLAESYKKSLHEARDELDDFQMGSRELEAELEAQLEQLEKKKKELESTNVRLQLECEALKEKLEKAQSESHHIVNDLQEELDHIKGIKDELSRYIRELEQSNDDLERTKRATIVSIEDFEQRLNQAIERNAFLESELDEKEALQITVQRLKDEARDLRSELSVKLKSDCKVHNKENLDNDEIEKSEKEDAEIIDSNKLMINSKTQTIDSPFKDSHNYNGLNGNGTPLTPSARISALNIVGDLLRRVGALESKLASCRNFVKEPPRHNKLSTSPLHSPRVNHLNQMNSSSPAGYMKISV